MAARSSSTPLLRGLFGVAAIEGTVGFVAGEHQEPTYAITLDKVREE